MRRVILLATLAVSLTFGPARVYAFPPNPCDPVTSQSAGTGSSQVQLLLLLLPTLISPIG